MKKFWLVILAIVLIAVGVLAWKYFTLQSADVANGEVTVTISILGADGQVILASTEAKTRSGASVLEVLQETAANENITVTLSEMSEFGIGVTEIGGLVADDGSEIPGWVYRVNGDSSTIGMGEMQISGGEIITIEFVNTF